MCQQLELKGFTATMWSDKYSEAIAQNLEWVKDGKLKYKETITEGFDNVFTSFLGMLKGENFGKAMVKV